MTGKCVYIYLEKVLSSECMGLNQESEKYFNRGENRTHGFDLASVTLYHLSYAVRVRILLNYDI